MGRLVAIGVGMTLAAMLGAVQSGASTGAEPGAVVVARAPLNPPATGIPASGRVGLAVVSSRRIDPATGSTWRAFPAWAPRSRRGLDLIVAASQPGTTMLGYGEIGGLTQTLVAFGPARREKGVFDVTSLGRGPYGLELRWARLVGSTLYVSNAHRTYAASSRNRNAYLTAVDAGTGAIRWRSPALVANADSFAIVGDVIVTGYGFTAEPDYLFALDRRTGAILARLPVPSAPERIRMTGSTLTVRTYDHVLTVRLSS